MVKTKTQTQTSQKLKLEAPVEPKPSISAKPFLILGGLLAGYVLLNTSKSEPIKVYTHEEQTANRQRVTDLMLKQDQVTEDMIWGIIATEPNTSTLCDLWNTDCEALEKAFKDNPIYQVYKEIVAKKIDWNPINKEIKPLYSYWRGFHKPNEASGIYTEYQAIWHKLVTAYNRQDYGNALAHSLLLYRLFPSVNTRWDIARLLELTENKYLVKVAHKLLFNIKDLLPAEEVNTFLNRLDAKINS